jgi:hypothetical protein
MSINFTLIIFKYFTLNILLDKRLFLYASITMGIRRKTYAAIHGLNYKGLINADDYALVWNRL